MKKMFFLVGLIVGVLMLGSFAHAQETAAATPDPNAVPAFTPPSKEAKSLPKPESKSLVRVIGQARMYAPGQQKKVALEQTAKEFAPGQTKTAIGLARQFSYKPLEAAARKKKIFEEISLKSKPQKPVKGYEKTFRGTPYKPTKFSGR